MTRQCRASGCTSLTTRYGAYCSTHKAKTRRHGAPDQRGVTKADLKPYLAQIQARIETNQGLTIWSLLDQRWAALGGLAEGFAGGIRSAWTRQAAKELQKLVIIVQPRKAVQTVLAIYLMREQAGHRFKSDKAFDTQLVRRLRGLTQANAQFSTSAKSGRQTRVYVELPPRVTAVIAEWVIGAIGTAGIWLSQQERRREERKKHEAQSFHAAITELGDQ